jgi:uncharacterized protein YjbJ (UPF0337 family)
LRWSFSQDYPVNSKHKEQRMNSEKLDGDWNLLKQKIKEQWDKLSDDHLDEIDGKRAELLEKLQETYSLTKEQAEEEVTEFLQRHQDKPTMH